MKYSIIILIILFSGIAGCSKSNDGAPTCLVSEVKSPADGSTTMKYNNEGKLIQVISPDVKSEFAYNGNKIEVLMSTNGVFFRKYIVTVLQNGLAESVRMETDASGNTWRNIVYTYNGEQMIRETRVYSYNSDVLVINYKWENGNMVSRNDGSQELKYEYYPDKPFDRNVDVADGQYWEVLRPKNLTKAIIAGTDKIGSVYSFDKDGKVLSRTVDNGSYTVTYTFGYECK